MKYFIVLLLTISSAQASAKDLAKATFQVSCERTYFRVVAEYFEGANLAKIAPGFVTSCKEMSSGYNLDMPVQLGCSLAIKQMKLSRPALPDKQEMYDRFCKEIAEN